MDIAIYRLVPVQGDLFAGSFFQKKAFRKTEP
jgi:hypothetical protein